MNTFYRKATLAAALASACASAWALDAATIKLSDSIGFTPTLKLSESYDDNFRALETREQSSWVSGIAPTFTFGAKGDKANASISYTANHEIYHSSHSDDNTDHIFSAETGLQFNARNRLRLNVGYRDMEETASADQKIENDKYTLGTVGALYTFGADTATGQVRLGATHDRLRYDNGIFGGTRLNADKERDSTGVSAAFLYRVGPKTRAVLEARHTDHEYESNTALDSTNTALLLGAEWEATARTTGTVRIGRERKDFDDSAMSDRTSPMWEVGVSWAPRTYSTFSLNTRRAFDEGSDSADVIKGTSTTLGWEHGWAPRLKSNLSYTYSKQTYRNAEDREDKIDTLSVGLTYNMRRWLDVGVGYKYSENDSSKLGKSYERNIFGVTLNASL